MRVVLKSRRDPKPPPQQSRGMRRQPTGVAHPQLRLHHERFCWAGTGCCSASDIFGFLSFFSCSRQSGAGTPPPGLRQKVSAASGIIEQSAPSVNGRCFLSDPHCGASFSALSASPRQHCQAMASNSPSGEQVGSLYHRDPLRTRSIQRISTARMVTSSLGPFGLHQRSIFPSSLSSTCSSVPVRLLSIVSSSCWLPNCFKSASMASGIPSV